MEQGFLTTLGAGLFMAFCVFVLMVLVLAFAYLFLAALLGKPNWLIDEAAENMKNMWSVRRHPRQVVRFIFGLNSLFIVVMFSIYLVVAIIAYFEVMTGSPGDP